MNNGPTLTERLKGWLRPRNLLIAGAIAYASWQQRDAVFDLFVEPTAANKQLKDFPGADTIEGASYVRKIRYRNAQYVLVHIRQSHDVPHATEQEREEIAKVQDDIERALHSLMHHEGVKLSELHVEGRFIGSQYTSLKNIENKIADLKSIIALKRSQITKWQKELAELRDQFNEEGKNIHPELIAFFEKAIVTSVNSIERHLMLLKDFEEEQKKEVKVLKLNAPERLEYEQDLKLKPAESEPLNERGVELMLESLNGKTDSAAIESNNEEREDVVLKLAMNNGRKILFVVYGAVHDWRDNVYRWNMQHPDRQVSLIEITPEKYHELNEKTPFFHLPVPRLGGRPSYVW